jgi:hypothetical protein
MRVEVNVQLEVTTTRNIAITIKPRGLHIVRCCWKDVIIMIMKITAFWNTAPCSLVGAHEFIALMMESVRTFETSVYFKGTTRRYVPEGCNLHTPP